MWFISNEKRTNFNNQQWLFIQILSMADSRNIFCVCFLDDHESVPRPDPEAQHRRASRDRGHLLQHQRDRRAHGYTHWVRLNWLKKLFHKNKIIVPIHKIGKLFWGFLRNFWAGKESKHFLNFSSELCIFHRFKKFYSPPPPKKNGTAALELI